MEGQNTKAIFKSHAHQKYVHKDTPSQIHQVCGRGGIEESIAIQTSFNACTYPTRGARARRNKRPHTLTITFTENTAIQTSFDMCTYPARGTRARGQKASTRTHNNTYFVCVGGGFVCTYPTRGARAWRRHLRRRVEEYAKLSDNDGKNGGRRKQIHEEVRIYIK